MSTSQTRQCPRRDLWGGSSSEGGTFRDPSVASAVAPAVAIFELVLRDEILQLRVDGTIEVPLEPELVVQMKFNVRIVALGLDV